MTANQPPDSAWRPHSFDHHLVKPVDMGELSLLLGPPGEAL
jgi:hypothetical protein